MSTTKPGYIYSQVVIVSASTSMPPTYSYQNPLTFSNQTSAQPKTAVTAIYSDYSTGLGANLTNMAAFSVAMGSIKSAAWGFSSYRRTSPHRGC